MRNARIQIALSVLFRNHTVAKGVGVDDLSSSYGTPYHCRHVPWFCFFFLRGVCAFCFCCHVVLSSPSATPDRRLLVCPSVRCIETKKGLGSKSCNETSKEEETINHDGPMPPTPQLTTYDTALSRQNHVEVVVAVL